MDSMIIMAVLGVNGMNDEKRNAEPAVPNIGTLKNWATRLTHDADGPERVLDEIEECIEELDRALAQHGEGRVPDQPLQPIIVDEQGVARFRRNEIVSFLLDAGPFDMNQLARMLFNDTDREQFAQLIGYSVSGFGELDYASEETVRRADSIADRLAAPSPDEADAQGDKSNG